MQLVGEVEQKGYMHIALHGFAVWTRENGEPFAIGVKIENSDESKSQFAVDYMGARR